MRTPEQSSVDADRRRTEAIVTRHVQEIFRSLPMLAGFWLRPDIELVELSVLSWPDCATGLDLHEEVILSLMELAETHPEAVRLMRGRTFARTVH